MLQRYTGGAWQDIEQLQKNTGSFADCEFARRQANGGWIDVWSGSYPYKIINKMRADDSYWSKYSYANTEGDKISGRLYERSLITIEFENIAINTVSLQYDLKGIQRFGFPKETTLASFVLFCRGFDGNGNFPSRDFFNRKNVMTAKEEKEALFIPTQLFNRFELSIFFSLSVNDQNYVDFVVNNIKINNKILKFKTENYIAES